MYVLLVELKDIIIYRIVSFEAWPPNTRLVSSPFSASLKFMTILQVAKEQSENMVSAADRKYIERRRYLNERQLRIQQMRSMRPMAL